MRKVQVICVIVLGLIASAAPAAQRRRGKPRPKPATVCGDPTATCRTSGMFEPYNLQFMLASDAVIFDTEDFYAVILKSVRDVSKGNDCNVFIPESERLDAQ